MCIRGVAERWGFWSSFFSVWITGLKVDALTQKTSRATSFFQSFKSTTLISDFEFYSSEKKIFKTNFTNNNAKWVSWVAFNAGEVYNSVMYNKIMYTKKNWALFNYVTVEIRQFIMLYIKLWRLQINLLMYHKHAFNYHYRLKFSRRHFLSKRIKNMLFSLNKLDLLHGFTERKKWYKLV